METLSNEVLALLTQFSRGEVNGIGAGSALLYLCVRVAQGRAGFAVPFVSRWLDALSPVAKASVVLVLGAGGGLLAATLTGGWALPVLLGGALNGALSAIGALGLHNGVNNVEKAMHKPVVEATPPGAAGPIED